MDNEKTLEEIDRGWPVGSIGRVRQDHHQTGEAMRELIQQRHQGIPILDIGGMDQDG